MDITACDGLKDLHADLAAQGVKLGLVRLRQDPVSYKHLTLPTSGLVEISVGAGTFKKKKKKHHSGRLRLLSSTKHR